MYYTSIGFVTLVFLLNNRQQSSYTLSKSYSFIFVVFTIASERNHVEVLQELPLLAALQINRFTSHPRKLQHRTERV